MAQKKPNQSIHALKIQFMKEFVPNIQSSVPTRSQPLEISDSDSDPDDSSPINSSPISLPNKISDRNVTESGSSSTETEASDSEEVKPPPTKNLVFPAPAPETNITLMEELKMKIESKNLHTKSKHGDIKRETKVSGVKRNVTEIVKKKPVTFDSNRIDISHSAGTNIRHSYSSGNSETVPSQSSKNVHTSHPPMSDKPNIVKKPPELLTKPNIVKKPPELFNKSNIVKNPPELFNKSNTVKNPPELRKNPNRNPTPSFGETSTRPVAENEKETKRRVPVVNKTVGRPLPPPPPPPPPTMNLATPASIPATADGRSNLLNDIRNFKSNSRLKPANENSDNKPAAKPVAKSHNESILSSLQDRMKEMRPHIAHSDDEEEDTSESDFEN